MLKNFIQAALVTLVLFFAHGAFAGECSLYETIHPNYPLTGSHLSTGKCTACASCHINGIFTGTPKICSTCHVKNSAYGAIGFSANHFAVGSTDCGSCHNTTSYTSTWNMDHSKVTGQSCTSCHNGSYITGYNALGQQSYVDGGKTYSHPLVQTGADCGNSGCHTAPAAGMNLSESLWQINLTAIHAGITTGCVTCHDNVHATGKASVPVSTSLPAGHPTTSDSCETCHSTTANFKCASILDLFKQHLASR